MALFRSRLERRLWLAAGGLLGAIYLSLAWVRPVSEALRDLGLLRATMIGAFLAVAAGAGRALARTRPGWREVAVLLPFAGFYLAVLATMERAEEAFHFVEYGALGGLVYGALAARRAAAPPNPPAIVDPGPNPPAAADPSPNPPAAADPSPNPPAAAEPPPAGSPALGPRALAPPALWAALLTGLAGWVDEGIQHVLPERYYDIRDVGFNALAGVIAVGAITAWRLVRRR